MLIDHIYIDDCFKIMSTMEDKCVDYSFTSPPYNRKRNDKYTYYDDTINDYFGFLCKFTDELLRLTKNHVFINIQKNYYNKSDVFKYIGEYSDKIKDIIVWTKSNPMPANGFNITNGYEFIIVMGDKSLKSNYTYTKNVITTSVNPDTSKIHKAVMNKKVSDWFVDNFTQKGDIVLDPFFGLGTTGVSCVEKDRHYIGIEINNEYSNIAMNRINECRLTIEE